MAFCALSPIGFGAGGAIDAVGVEGDAEAAGAPVDVEAGDAEGIPFGLTPNDAPAGSV